MCRCRSCNGQMKSSEMAKQLPDGSWNDLCNRCVFASQDEQYEHDFVLGSLTEDLVGISGIQFCRYIE
jgi:hypothetical protein